MATALVQVDEALKREGDSKCQERQEAVEQTLGSLALEGLEPDTRFVALMNRYVSGELTLEQVREMLLAESAERYGVERAA